MKADGRLPVAASTVESKAAQHKIEPSQISKRTAEIDLGPPPPPPALDPCVQSFSATQRFRRKHPSIWPLFGAFAAMFLILIAAVGIALLVTRSQLITRRTTPQNPTAEPATPNDLNSPAADKKAFDDVCNELQVGLSSLSQPQYKKLEPLHEELNQIRTEMEVSVKNEDFKNAIELCKRMRTKLDEYNVSLKKLEDGKKSYDAAMVQLPKRIESKSRYNKLQADQQQIIQLENQINGFAQQEEFGQALEFQKSNGLARKINDYNDALKKLDSQRTRYGEALAGLQTKLVDFQSIPQEIENLKIQIASSANSEDFDFALELISKATKLADATIRQIHGVEIAKKENPQDYVRQTKIAETTATKPNQINLQLKHPSLAKGLSYHLSLPRDSDGNRTWDISVGPQDTFPFGSFQLMQSELIFKWNGEAARQPSCRALRNCLLKIKTTQPDHDSRIQRIVLRKPINIEPFAIDESRGERVRQFPMEDMWPTVQIKLSNIYCDSAIAKTKAPLYVVTIGAASRDNGSLFYQLELGNSATDNEYSRNCDVKLIYLGIKIPKRLPSEWPIGVETNTDFHTHRIFETQVPEWLDRIGKRTDKLQDKITELQNKSKEDKRDYQREIDSLREHIARLNKENEFVTKTVQENLSQAKTATISFEICYELTDDDGPWQIPLARTSPKRGSDSKH